MQKTALPHRGRAVCLLKSHRFQRFHRIPSSAEDGTKSNRVIFGDMRLENDTLFFGMPLALIRLALKHATSMFLFRAHMQGRATFVQAIELCPVCIPLSPKARAFGDTLPALPHCGRAALFFMAALRCAAAASRCSKTESGYQPRPASPGPESFCTAVPRWGRQ